MRLRSPTWFAPASASAAQCAWAPLLACLVLTVPACNPQPIVRAPTKVAVAPPRAIDDAHFAAAVEELLTDDPTTAQHAATLGGVVQRQLARATRRFEAGHPEAGVAALEGAFALVQLGQLTPPMMNGSRGALAPAARETARRGDEGRSAFLYEELLKQLPAGPERAETEGHLKAIRAWLAAGQKREALLASAQRQRVASSRVVLDSSKRAIDVARASTLEWLQAALELHSRDERAGDLERDEAVESYRALRSGPMSLIALYLRHGDAKSGLLALSERQLDQVVPASLRDRLERAARDDAAAWMDLERLFSRAADESQPETSIDAGLARAAAFGAALRLYRLAPTEPEAGATLARHLAQRGFGEVAMRLVSRVLGKATEPPRLGWALAFLNDAIAEEVQAGALDDARRVLAAGRPILERASEPGLREKVRPSAAQLLYVMAVHETRDGELDGARARVKESLALAPALPSYELLATLELHAERVADARTALTAATRIARAANDLDAEVRLSVIAYDVERASSDATGAAVVLRRALERALDARKTAQTDVDSARAERQLAHVLSLYGRADLARKAWGRALDASRSDARQLAATVQEATRDALTTGDVRAAREALRLAIDLQVADEELLYAALWVRLTERRTKTPADGLVEEALTRIDESPGWLGKLTEWARGSRSDADLVTAARTLAERTEARFYTALGGKSESPTVTPPAPMALPEPLLEVARSKALQLVEVAISRELVARHASQPPAFPADVALP